MAKSRKALLLRLALCSALIPGAAFAQTETLQDVLARAYRNNPTLASARANQRATAENVPIQKAAGRPDAGVSATYTENLERSSPSVQARRGVGAQADIFVPIYSGGAVRNAVNAAELRVTAGQNDLRATEASIFSQVVAAYMDVIRDGAIVALNAQNVSLLEVNLRATSDRFEGGDLTRTDVAQSSARLALARAQLQNAEAQLIFSRENFIALVGSPPGELAAPAPLNGLPLSPQQAVELALVDNPDIIAAQRSREAARYDVRVARAGVAPRLSAFARGDYQNSLNSNPFTGSALTPSANSTQSAAVGATISIPLYQGGLPAARERQAAAFESAAIERSIEVERSVIAQVRSAYASWRASLSTIESTQTAVEAANLSLQGVRAENSVGTRTILDILNAEQEALNARVQNVSAKRDAYVAAFSLLAAMGRADAGELGIDPSLLQDPDAYYRRVRGKWSDFDFAPAPQPTTGSTRDTPPQDAQPGAGAASILPTGATPQ